MNYSWTGHIKSVARLLCKDGSGWVPEAVYGVTAAGTALVSPYSPSAARYSLLGANARVLAEALRPGMTALECGDRLSRLTGTVMHLYFKAGLAPVRQAHPTTALLRLRETDWNTVQKLLRSAYTIAKAAE
jgi:hypothetical protein